MRSPDQLLHTRTRVRDRWALLPLEGYPTSRLPHWFNTEARVLASPRLGAQFVQYLLDVRPDGGAKVEPDGKVESFLYCMSGEASLSLSEGRTTLAEGGYAFIPHSSEYRLKATQPTRLILLRKNYETAIGVAEPAPIFGNERDVKPEPFLGNEHARLQLLIPDELPYDFAMNIFTFDPGHCLPYVETHVMEHGLYFMQGKGVYYLGEEWMEVTKDDFIWMGPYCPQCFYATGEQAAKYLYYKNVNREIPP
jgi:(S)-ureidoglycine aminohydrolase